MKLTCAASCPTLCDFMDCSLPGSSVHGIFQASLLEWVAISSSRGSSQPRNETYIFCISCTAEEFFSTSTTWKALWNWSLVPKTLETAAQYVINIATGATNTIIYLISVSQRDHKLHEGKDYVRYLEDLTPIHSQRLYELLLTWVSISGDAHTYIWSMFVLEKWEDWLEA